MKTIKSTNPSKKVLVLFALMVAMIGGCMAQTQVTIPGTKVKFSFPGKWNYLKADKVDKNTTVYFYYYSSRILVSKGDTALPYLRIRVRKNYTGDLVDYVYDRYVAEPYQPLRDYTQGLGLPKSGGMGYIGAYTNLGNKKDYEFRMVYFKSQNAIVEFRLETTRATYNDMAKEFEAILASLTF